MGSLFQGRHKRDKLQSKMDIIVRPTGPWVIRTHRKIMSIQWLDPEEPGSSRTESIVANNPLYEYAYN